MGKTSINEQDQEGKRMNGIPHLTGIGRLCASYGGTDGGTS